MINTQFCDFSAFIALNLDISAVYIRFEQ